ncbi:MAG: heavy-metal-associated domain-containing protein [Candidatus Marinimicrobia bacterium]|nr:heavy-metal-associated domain-containing protein [Candidatus Neomarinimicrobiota bacterium]MCF7851573.1 heavy-metal-associated domain-containing protein [Candidatus Neomarinimicrobiota bacterium]
MSSYKFKVSNMNCAGCVANIERALSSVEKIDTFDIELSEKRVSVDSDLDEQAVAQVIIEAGYEAVPDDGRQGFLSKLFNK